MQIVIFEEQAETLDPIALARPEFDIHIGGTTLYEAASRIADSVIVKARPLLAPLVKRGASKLSGDVLFLNGRVAPDLKVLSTIEKDMPRNSVLKKDGVIVALRCPASRVKMKPTIDSLLETLSKLKLKSAKVKLQLLDHPWEVVGKNIELLKSNLDILSSDYSEYESGIFVGEDVEIHHTAVMDSSKGPIVFGSGTKIKPYAVIEGPVFMGAECSVHPHAWIRSETSIAHNCKVGGEVEALVMQEYSNKQHHGFFGHAYVGSWVNMGAGTTNSDLKNTYGTVKVRISNRIFDTHLQFFGCIIGDYCKTAINCTILTGKVVGLSSHLYGVITESVPCFTNYARDLGTLSEFYLESAIETQKRMFSRRGIQQTEAHKTLLKSVYKQTIDLRRIAGVPKKRLMFR